MTPRVLVAGIGNIFLGDDAFGCEVVARLAGTPFPPHVRVVDFGIRGLDLADALERCDAAILIDALARGGAPGTLYVIEPSRGDAGAIARAEGLATHAMTPDRVLGALEPGTGPKVVRIVGCEPERFEDDGDMGLSAPVSAAVDEAVRMVTALIDELGEGARA